MFDPLDKTFDLAERLVEQARGEDPGSWIDFTPWKRNALLVLIGLAVLLWLWKRIARTIRRRRPPTIHPLLEKYGRDFEEPSEKLKSKRRVEAAKVVATSSTTTIAGYEIIEQVEAVYVDGFRRPEEALEGLKAVAAMKGANALTNVRHERGTSGRCSASGDAMIVRKLDGDTGRTTDSQKAPTGASTSTPAEPPEPRP